MGYPGIELSENGEKIKGFIFKSENLLNHWKILDDFEGEGYERVLTKAKLKDENIVETYIYTLKKC